MGSSSWDSKSYSSYKSSVSSKSTRDIFRSTKIHEDLDPSKFEFRESRDSDVNPNSTPILVGADVTGSMGFLATQIIKESLGVIVEEIIKRKPISDPHILLAAIGDMEWDQAPLQTTQFEADTCIIEQIEKFYIEQGGGANNGESYPALWWFAQNKTQCDSIIKRNRKGYIFTIGDERPLNIMSKVAIQGFLGGKVQENSSIDELLNEVQQSWNIFHLITPTNATRRQSADEAWKKLLGQNAIIVEDHTKLGEIIVSIMQVNEGEDVDSVIDSWDSSTSLAVQKSVGDLAPSMNKTEIIEI